MLSPRLLVADDHAPPIAVRGPCDLRCAWCNYRGSVNFDVSDEVTRVGAELRRLSDEGHRAVTLGFRHTEPTTHPDLRQIVALAKTLGFEKVMLSTSGLTIVNREYLARLRDDGLTDVIVTIAGAEGGLTDLLLGRAGASQAKLDALQVCREVGVHIFAILALLRPTLHGLDELVRLLMQIIHPDDVLHAQVLDPVFNTSDRRFSQLWPRPGEILWVMERLRRVEPSLSLSAGALPCCLVEALGDAVRLSPDRPDKSFDRFCGDCPVEGCPGVLSSHFGDGRSTSSPLILRPTEPPTISAESLRRVLGASGDTQTVGSEDLRYSEHILGRMLEMNRPLCGFVVSGIERYPGRLEVRLSPLDRTEGSRLTVLVEEAAEAECFYISGPRFALSFRSDTPMNSDGKVKVLHALQELLERRAPVSRKFLDSP